MVWQAGRRRLWRKRYGLPLAVLGVVLALNAAADGGIGAAGDATATRPPGVPADVQRGVVEHIVDGDTIWVRVDEPGGPLVPDATHKIRLLEIDTPETRDPNRGLQCWGPEATAFAEERLAVGSTVYLQSDDEDTDRYGRFLRYVWTDDGKLFNREAVLAGHARAALYEPNDRHIAAIRDAEASAKAEGRGMWGEPCRYNTGPDANAAAAERGEGLASRPTAVEPLGGSGTRCEPGYDPCVPAYPPDVNCGALSGPYTVTGPDRHRLDGDGDGIGCEG